MTKQHKKIEDGEAKIKVSTLAYAIAICLIVVLGVASILAYGTSTEIGGKIAAKIAKIVPFPVVVVDWRHVVFASDVQANLASVEKFYKTQDFASEGLRVDFSTEDGKKRLKIKEREIIDKLIEDRVIEILAKKQGINYSEKDASAVLEEKLNEFGTTDDIKKDLADSYGWSIEDFKARVVLPGLYAEALSQKVLAMDPENAGAKEKIKLAQTQLEAGKDFTEVVRSYSQGSSKDAGGELGWVKKEQVVGELQSALFGGQTPKKNEIIESSVGFHIVDIENRKKEDGQELLQLRQVFVPKNTFTDWLVAQKKQMSVFIPLKGFVWDSKLGAVDFSDEKMRSFEQDERAKTKGDASIMF